MSLNSTKFDQDLTESEMARDKDLRKQRNVKNAELTMGEGHFKYGMTRFGDDEMDSKYYWGIRNGEVRKIKKL